MTFQPVDVATLRQAVQHNCNISDARHAQDYTMCVYLLKMREYFRWEGGYGLTESLPRDELGGWVEGREAHWRDIRDQDFACLEAGADCIDPFDVDAMNAMLIPQGLVYSAGFGRFVKPHFFLAELCAHQQRDGFHILVSGTETARDMSADPAMLREQTIYIRRDALQRLLWEKLEEWRWRKSPDDAMGRCVRAYAIDDADELLDAMTDNEVEAAILHEYGEGVAGRELGDEWNRMLLDAAHSKAEIRARAVRDLIADCTVTVPGLVQRGQQASLHFFFANFRHLRKALHPALETAYQQWCAHGDVQSLLAEAERGAGHWRDVARRVLGMPREHGEQLALMSDMMDNSLLA